MSNRGDKRHVLYSREMQRLIGLLSTKRLLSKRSAHNLVFHLSELLQVALGFRRYHQAILEAVAKDKPDPDALGDACGSLIAELWHIVYHVRRLRPSVEALLAEAVKRGEDEGLPFAGGDTERRARRKRGGTRIGIRGSARLSR